MKTEDSQKDIEVPAISWLALYSHSLCQTDPFWKVLLKTEAKWRKKYTSERKECSFKFINISADMNLDNIRQMFVTLISLVCRWLLCLYQWWQISAPPSVCLALFYFQQQTSKTRRGPAVLIRGGGRGGGQGEWPSEFSPVTTQSQVMKTTVNSEKQSNDLKCIFKYIISLRQHVCSLCLLCMSQSCLINMYKYIHIPLISNIFIIIFHWRS